MPIILLTHKRETFRKTNTGSLVIETLGEKAQKILWERVNPDPFLLKIIEAGSIALLYPGQDSKNIGETVAYENYVIIDSTWQEAQKIYNRSPYLQALPQVKVASNQLSRYHLRRNQKNEGLCTAEVVMEVLKQEKSDLLAEELQEKFRDFLER